MKGIFDVLNYSFCIFLIQVQFIVVQEVVLDFFLFYKGWMIYVMELRFGDGDFSQCMVKVVCFVVYYIKELVVICCFREMVFSLREDIREKNVGFGVDFLNFVCQVLVYFQYSWNGGIIGQVVGIYMKNYYFVVWFGMLYFFKYLWNLKF